jgi:hypothetical protein
MTGSIPNWEQHDEAPRFAAASRTPSEQWGEVVSRTGQRGLFAARSALHRSHRSRRSCLVGHDMTINVTQRQEQLM